MNLKDLALNKNIHYKDKDWTIVEVVNVGPDGYGFRLQPIKGRKDTSNLIGPRAIANGIATTDSQDLVDACKELINKADKDKTDKEQAAIARKEKEDKEKEAQKAEADALRRDLTIKDAKMHVEDNNRKVYNMFRNPFKYLNSPTYRQLIAKYDKDLYMVTFEEAEREKKDNELAARRITFSLDEYPGDIKELLKWMEDNITSIDISADEKVAEREQRALDKVNNDLGTNFQVKITSDIYPSYKAHFKNIKSAPEEFKSWMVKKHSGETTDINVWVDGLAVDDKGNLRSNAVVKDLIFNPKYQYIVKNKFGKKAESLKPMTVNEALKYLKKQK